MATQIIDKFLLPSHNKPNKLYRFKSPDKFNSYEELNQKVQIHCLFTFLGCFSRFGYLNVWQLNHHGNDLDSGGRWPRPSPLLPFSFLRLFSLFTCDPSHPFLSPVLSPFHVFLLISPILWIRTKCLSLLVFVPFWQQKQHSIPGNEKGKY